VTHDHGENELKNSAQQQMYGQQQPMYIKQGRPGGAGAGAAAGGGILGQSQHAFFEHTADY